MNRFASALLSLALVLGLAAPSLAGTTSGKLLFSSLNHTSQTTLIDTLLGAAVDTTSAVTIRDVRAFTVYFAVDKYVQDGNVTVTHQVSPNGDDWATLATSTVAGNATGVTAINLLNDVVPDSSDVASIAAADKYRAILTKADGTSADSIMVRALTFIRRD